MKKYISAFTLILLCHFSFGQTPCVDGMAGEYPCENVDLISHLTLDDVGGGFLLNDSWGWTDPVSGREFAIVGRGTGTSFIDMTDPFNPVYLGNLPTHTSPSIWRDMKVYNDHVFIVSEAEDHGMQVFDLTQLISVTDAPVEFEETEYYGEFGHSHNIALNEQTGYAYGVGTDTYEGGLHIVDVSDPTNPTIAGGYSDDGYTHDAQIVIYKGADADYANQEIAFCCNEDQLAIVNVNDKEDCYLIAHGDYIDVGYTHQGWLTPDHNYFLMNDEGDELDFDVDTRTYVFDVSDLDNPTFVGFYQSDVNSTDHNLYTKGQLVFEANYSSGMRVLKMNDLTTADLEEVGYFDTNPEDDGAGYDGVWNVYPYFESGYITINSQENGFFIVKLTEEIEALNIQESKEIEIKVGPNPAEDFLRIQMDFSTWNSRNLNIYNPLGQLVKSQTNLPAFGSSFNLDISDLATGIYTVHFDGIEKGITIVKK